VTAEIRSARPDEYPAVARLTVTAYEEFAGQIGPEHWAHYRANLAEVAHRAERGDILVAEAGGRLAGAVSYYPPASSPAEAAASEWWWWPYDYAYFRALAVDPALRGRGIGRALIDACIARARAGGARGIALNTAPVMAVAVALYERLGFARVRGPAEEEPAGGTESGDSAWTLLSYQLTFDADAGASGQPAGEIRSGLIESR
jgi:ribosomal protein S18 acetylase RimI-like enzyme